MYYDLRSKDKITVSPNIKKKKAIKMIVPGASSPASVDPSVKPQRGTHKNEQIQERRRKKGEKKGENRLIISSW